MKQYVKVTYLSCILDETLSGEYMTILVVFKINSRLNIGKTDSFMFFYVDCYTMQRSILSLTTRLMFAIQTQMTN